MTEVVCDNYFFLHNTEIEGKHIKYECRYIFIPTLIGLYVYFGRKLVSYRILGKACLMLSYSSLSKLNMVGCSTSFLVFKTRGCLLKFLKTFYELKYFILKKKWIISFTVCSDLDERGCHVV